MNFLKKFKYKIALDFDIAYLKTYKNMPENTKKAQIYLCFSICDGVPLSTRGLRMCKFELRLSFIDQPIRDITAQRLQNQTQID